MNRRGMTKWQRRGKATAEFTVAFLTVLVKAIFISIHTVAKSAWLLLRGDRKRSSARIASPRQTSNPGLMESALVPKARFDSIAGLESTKQEILVRTLYPLHNPEQASTYKVETGGGILLWGPPGCGKTLLARGVAGELDAHFYHVRASTLIDQWVGEAEKNVASLFREVRTHKCSVLFIDEIDSLCPSRRRNRSTVMRRVIAEFLSQMDGLDSDCRRSAQDGFLLVFGATNWPVAMYRGEFFRIR